MRGSVYKRKTKKGIVYDIVFDLHTGGKRKQKWIRGFKTQKEAEAALAKAIAEVESGIFCDPGRITVGEYLDRWLKHIKPGVAPRTFDGYAHMVERHIKPALGRIRLARLLPTQLQDYYTALVEQKRLSTTTALHHHRLLHAALKQAVKWQLIFRNPADAVDPPKMEKREQRTLTEEGVFTLLDSLRETCYYIPTLLAAATGMRLGEILGLRWQDVDLAGGMLTVVQVYQRLADGTLIFHKPKTVGSRRPIPLPPFVVEELRRHQRRQKEWRLKAGGAWQETGLVCTREDGSPFNPNGFSRRFIALAKRVGLDVSFHELRHTQATLLLKWGVHPRIVAERLGHSTTRLTLDTYSHVLPTMQDEAVKLLQERLFQKQR